MRRSTPTPLLRHAVVRVVIAVLLVLDGLVIAAAVWWSLVWLPHPETLLVVPAAVAAVPVAALAVYRGRVSGLATATALALTAALHLAIAGVGALWAADAWRTRQALATPPETTALWLAVVVAALVVLASLAVCVALPLSRGLLVAAVATLGALAVAGGAGAAVAAGTDECAAFRFSAERWRAAVRAAPEEDDEAVALADALIRCGTLDGRSRAGVRRLLGEPHRRSGRTWAWSVGWVNDFLGPGDAADLTVRFDARGRVAGAERSYGAG